MTERQRNLEHAVRELETELDSLENLDEPSRAALEQVLSHIQQTLTGTESPASHSALRAPLQKAIADFEVSHPTISGIVARILDSLGQMGI